MNTNRKVEPNAEGKPVDHTKYQGIIGSMFYLTASIPIISYAVGVYARYQVDPKKSSPGSSKDDIAISQRHTLWVCGILLMFTLF